MTAPGTDRDRRGAVALLTVAIPVGVLVAGLLVGGAAGGTAGVDPVTQVGLQEGPAPAQPAPGPPPEQAAPSGTGLPRPDDRWLSTVAGRTGIGARALSAYASADLRLAVESPRCDVSWATLAGVGYVESHHGTIGGRVLGVDGRPGLLPIIGVALSGAGAVALVADSDQGRLDGDARYDRAVGPMQFVPQTWRQWGADGDGDAVVDPQDIDDAVYSAARYLCASGGPLDATDGWTRAVLSYNRSATYLADVLAATNTYASRARA